jgi:hypothetical protein
MQVSDPLHRAPLADLAHVRADLARVRADLARVRGVVLAPAVAHVRGAAHVQAVVGIAPAAMGGLEVRVAALAVAARLGWDRARL